MTKRGTNRIIDSVVAPVVPHYNHYVSNTNTAHKLETRFQSCRSCFCGRPSLPRDPDQARTPQEPLPSRQYSSEASHRMLQLEWLTHLRSCRVIRNGTSRYRRVKDQVRILRPWRKSQAIRLGFNLEPISNRLPSDGIQRSPASATGFPSRIKSGMTLFRGNDGLSSLQDSLGSPGHRRRLAFWTVFWPRDSIHGEIWSLISDRLILFGTPREACGDQREHRSTTGSPRLRG